jgi:enterochelin esterase family protein
MSERQSSGGAVLVMILVLGACAVASAQRQGAIVSPEVHADRKATFRLKAPTAQKVLLVANFLSESQPLTKDEEGLWSVTVGPLAPEVYEYRFIVDGLSIPDLVNPDVKVWRRVSRSMVLVPGEEPMFYEEQKVPHGTVHIHTYDSTSLGVTRRLYVYTPAGYETETLRRYPVLYLLHGSGDTELTWTVVGRANIILDNAIAQKRARPMIVVMPYGHTPGAARDKSRTRRGEAFEADLIEDVAPYVRRHYRIVEGPEHTAIVGLSMGGGQALRIGLGHPERFAWIGAFSSAAPDEEELGVLLAEPDVLNARLKLLWIGCGRSDFLFEANQRFLKALKAKGIKHVAHITDGSHEWRVWRYYLNEILPLLFQADD